VRDRLVLAQIRDKPLTEVGEAFEDVAIYGTRLAIVSTSGLKDEPR
jgi:hypothetical protein